MKRVVFVTSQYLNSTHKAGFHWLAEAFWNAGWHVLFFTESISWLSYLARNERCKYPLFAERNRLCRLRERMDSYVWMTPFHPVNTRNSALNLVATPLYRYYSCFSLGDAEPEVARADLIVFDSDHGLFLFERFKNLNPKARFVYRVSDDIRMMRHHPLLPRHEDALISRFDLVSAPSRVLTRRLGKSSNICFHMHGLQKRLFDRPHENPYVHPGPNVVYVGKHYFEAAFVTRAARLFPDWAFHVIGDVPAPEPAPNVTCYRERPFAELVPYLQHADIGLQSLAYVPGAEAFVDSLKMFQYTYCRLPIVAPRFMQHDREHVFYYEPGDDASIRAALLTAKSFERTRISMTDILTWDDLAVKLAA